MACGVVRRVRSPLNPHVADSFIQIKHRSISYDREDSVCIVDFIHEKVVALGILWQCSGCQNKWSSDVSSDEIGLWKIPYSFDMVVSSNIIENNG